jgi:hypothetical protein
MPEPRQNDESGPNREVGWRRRLERDRLLRQMTEEPAEGFPGPGAVGGGSSAAPSNPATATKDIINKVKLRLKFWYTFYYVLPLLAIIGLKLKDDDEIRKKARKIVSPAGDKGGTPEKKNSSRHPGPGAAETGGTGSTGASGGGGGDGGSGCAGFLVSKIDSCLMVEWCCAGAACGAFMLSIFALVALLAIIGCSALELLSFVGLSC